MFTQKDVELVAHFRMSGVLSIWDRTPKGQIRFDIRNGHIQELNSLLSRPLQTQVDVNKLKKQVRAYIVNNDIAQC